MQFYQKGNSLTMVSIFNLLCKSKYLKKLPGMPAYDFFRFYLSYNTAIFIFLMNLIMRSKK